MHIIQAQILAILFALCAAKRDAGVVKAFRDYVPVNNPYVKGFHLYGAILTGIFCLSFGWAGIVCLLWFWLVFDVSVNVLTKGWSEFDYIGETAKTDRMLRKVFGQYGGDAKSLALLLIIIALNFIL